MEQHTFDTIKEIREVTEAQNRLEQFEQELDAATNTIISFLTDDQFRTWRLIEALITQTVESGKYPHPNTEDIRENLKKIDLILSRPDRPRG